MQYVKEGDRVSIISNQAKELINNEVNIGESTDFLDDLVETKKCFYDFYGESSKEYQIATSLINVIRMIKRSLNHQKEKPTLTLTQWVEKQPIRVSYVNKLSSLLD